MNIHIYRNPANTLDFNLIGSELQSYFPNIPIDIRPPFLNNVEDTLAVILESLRILDIKKPFSEQPRKNGLGRSDHTISFEKDFLNSLISNDTTNSSRTSEIPNKEVTLYDGFMFQRLLETLIKEEESNTNHIHIVFEDRLICTFSEEDWHYHARTFVGGSPSIISTTGIIEGPAKPKEWYLKQMELSIFNTSQYEEQNDKISPLNVEKYLDYGDYRINFASIGYALQALFFFLTNGEPFCNNINCRLYNAHWQEELIHSQIQNSGLCNKHKQLLTQFNIKS